MIGSTAPGWEAVRAGFETNFASNLELGAQLCIYHGEECVVDLAGRSSKQPDYSAEHLQCVYSSGKNMEAICLAMLVDRGLVQYDDPVAKHWPEFSQNGKEQITVADVMRHEGRLPYLCEPGSPNGLTTVLKSHLDNVDELEKIIENSNPTTEADIRAYHAITRGWIVSGVLRRVDPKKRTLGVFMKEEISDPLGVAYFCGIPEADQGKYKYADMTQMPLWYNLAFEVIPAKLGMGCPLLGAAMKIFNDTSNPLTKKAVEWMGAPPTPAFNNTVAGRKAEIPSAGMYTNARSMAKVNACMANGGALGSVRIMSEEACAASMAASTSKMDLAMKCSFPFTQGGFSEVAAATGPLVDPSFEPFAKGFVGWGGWGGSISLWNPAKRVGLSYSMNGMTNYLLGGPRCLSIFEPLHQCMSKL